MHRRTTAPAQLPKQARTRPTLSPRRSRTRRRRLHGSSATSCSRWRCYSLRGSPRSRVELELSPFAQRSWRRLPQRGLLRPRPDKPGLVGLAECRKPLRNHRRHALAVPERVRARDTSDDTVWTVRRCPERVVLALHDEGRDVDGIELVEAALLGPTARGERE